MISLLMMLGLALVSTKLYVLPDAALKNSMRIVGGIGSGKSRLLGRLIAFQTLVRRRPQVILDPTGSVTANLLDKLLRLPLALGKQLLARIVYVGVGATDYLVPSPLYYRLHADETLFAVANRFIAVLSRQDPNLRSAPILGYNALYECGIYAGQLAAALGRQLDFVADLIHHPQRYKHDLTRALAQYPELADAVTYFRQLMDPTSQGLREKRTGSFANKLLPFVADETLLATYGARQRALDWEQVVQQGQTVIVDFAQEQEPDRRQFAFIWWFRDLLTFAKQRGLRGRGQEILFVIDELSQLVGQATREGNALLVADLNELIQVVARQMGLSTVIAHQSLSQLDEQVNRVLMGCGTQMIGNIADPDDALLLARQFLHYDPFWVKRREPVWMNVQRLDEFGMPAYSLPKIIDWRDESYSPEEQLLLATQQFRLPKFNFWLRPATGEGTISDRLYRISIENLDRSQYPDAQQVGRVLTQLRQRHGVAMADLLAEIRRPAVQEREPKPGKAQEEKQMRVNQKEESATIGVNSTVPYACPQATTIPLAAESAAGTPPVASEPAAEQPGAADEDFWR